MVASTDVRGAMWPLLLVLFAVAMAACGETGNGVVTATPTEDPFGLPPTLSGNVVEVVPAHGSRVTQAETRSGSLNAPSGVCVRANFEGLPERTLWFRMAIDGVEVTDRLVWFLSAQDAMEGTACYWQADGLPVGLHNAAVVVQNPFNLSEPPRQLVAWAFEVTP